jgi:Fe-S cluster assembly protein SufD
MEMETSTLRKVDSFIKTLTETNGFVPVSVRKKALENIEKTDFPTTKDEHWKYTRLGKISSLHPVINQSSVLQHIDEQLIVSKDFPLLVLENGFLREDLSTSANTNGLHLRKFSELSPAELALLFETNGDGDIFTSLNTAFLTDGFFLEIDANTRCEKPIHVLHITTSENSIANTIFFVKAHNSSAVELILSSHTAGNFMAFLNQQIHVDLGENAHVTINKWQLDGDQSRIIARENIRQKANSTFTIHTLTLGGLLVRNDLTIRVEGSNCTTNLNGIYVPKGKQHIDNHTTVDHITPHCQSNELYKGVIYDQGTAVFNGKVFVRPNAQQINAFQSNGNVLMSPDASVNSKPELEIYADDVKCSHGSTTGQLDEEAVFYLRARGLSETSARNLMVSAFVGEVVEKIENENVKCFVEAQLELCFGWE